VSIVILLITSLFVVSVVGATVFAAEPTDLNVKNSSKLKNVIIMISDGCGYNTITATDYYQYGKTGKQVYEHFPVAIGMSTYPAPPDGHGYNTTLAWANFSYVKSNFTDSGAAATAMSTGIKTYNGAIGVDVNKKPAKHLLENAEELGKSTGVVTTVEWSHATPAGFVAHNVSRNNYEGIAKEMIFNSSVDVVMGAGNPWFDNNGTAIETPNTFKYVGGQSTWNSLVQGTAGGAAGHWTLIQDRSDFKKLMHGPTPKRVVGTAQAFETMQQARGGNTSAAPYESAFNKNVPTLSEMSLGALNVLHNSPNGLFLMIEGGAVDWTAHANQKGRLIEEEIDFNQAVEAVNKWVEKNSNWGETLLIVTGDHETGYITGPGSDPTWKPLVNDGAGNVPGMEWHSDEHTNRLIPFYAQGAWAQLYVLCARHCDSIHGRYIDNTDMPKLIFSIWKAPSVATQAYMNTLSVPSI
jgi:alkaline phosphatase